MKKMIGLLDYWITGLLFSMIILSGCSEQTQSVNNVREFADSIEQEILQADRSELLYFDEAKVSGLHQSLYKTDRNKKDKEYYPELDRLAKTIALNQQALKKSLINSMSASTIREGIVNLTQATNGKRHGEWASGLVNQIETYRNHLYAGTYSDIALGNTLDKLSKDLNIYFPVDEHRKNVLLNKEDFIVTFVYPDKDETKEFYLKGYNSKGRVIYLSSEKVPVQNTLVVTYTEGQESQIVQPIKDCPEALIGEECPLPVVDEPDPVETADGFNVTKFKTKNIHDGWFDGDLEIRIEIKQSLASLDIDSIFPISGELERHSLMNQTIHYDAGHWYFYWYQFRFRNSNKWKSVNYRRRMADRQRYLDLFGNRFFNNKFTLKVTEVDFTEISSKVYFDEDYYFDTYNYGYEREFNAEGGKFWIVIDRNNYPLSSY